MKRSAGSVLFTIIVFTLIMSAGSSESQTAAFKGEGVSLSKTENLPSYTILHSFSGYPDDGADSGGPLFLDHKGNLYGTTQLGGAYDGGTVFKLSKDGTTSLLYSFSEADFGTYAYPAGILLLDHKGNIYSTAAGRVFKLGIDGGLTVYNQTLTKDLAMDNQQNIYGTNSGMFGYGGIFKLDPMTGTATVLHNFAESRLEGADLYPGLMLDSKGNLYGTAEEGGAFNYGTVYKLDVSGNLTVLHSFTGGTDGKYPYYAGVIRDNQGNLYGTTIGDFVSNFGTVYKIDANGSLTVLHTFQGGATDGAKPNRGLILDKKGNLYGTTWDGGPTNDGTLYKIDANGTFTLLHTFSWADGVKPLAGVIMDHDGNLYGTTVGGGPLGRGTVYKLSFDR